MSIRLNSISIQGFKSIQSLDNFSPGDLTVLVGPNGAGKSNFISFFRAMSHMMSGELQTHLSMTGLAQGWLFDGPEISQSVSASISLGTDKGTNEYEFNLEHRGGDGLIFGVERFRFLPLNCDEPGPPCTIAGGHYESRLWDLAEKGEPTPKAIRAILRKIIVHQFHNTSYNSRMKQPWRLGDNRWIKEDGGNLAPFLFRLRDEHPAEYARIVSTIRLGIPFFLDFDLHPINGQVVLEWREEGSDKVFSAGQASDGMLRFFALVSLLLQPPKDLPAVLILDEPELGLHPRAMATIATLIRAASKTTQIILATQSMTLLSQFDTADLVVVEREGRASTFTRKDKKAFAAWVGGYSALPQVPPKKAAIVVVPASKSA